MKLAAYTRVSTDKQDISHDVQHAAINQYASMQGHDIIALINDTHSGSSNLRESEKWDEVNELLDSGAVDGVIVYKFDRLARSVPDFATVIDRARREDWALMSVQEQLDMSTATGRMIANVLMSVAQWEREIIGERTSAAMQELIKQGHQMGRPAKEVPRGHRVDIRRMHFVDGKSLRQIADDTGYSRRVVTRIVRDDY